MHIILKVLPFTLFSSLLACGVLGGGNCEDAVTQSETSNGTFTYEVSDAGAGDAGGGEAGTSGTSGTSKGDLGAASGLTVAARTLLDEDSGAPIADPTSIVVSGSFTDTSGQSQSFFMIINGVPSSGSAPLGDGSEACLDDVASCTPLTGTIETTTFANDCSGQDGCALTIAGTLAAATTWQGGSFSVDIALGHEDVWAPSTCP
jgi:hypothetical protein